MNTISKSVVLLSVAIIISSMTQAAPGNGTKDGGTTFNKMDQNASFIYGDNLVTDVMLESDVGVAFGAQTPEDKAAGMSAIMVTPNGDMFESKMDPKDAAIFEKAIKALEKAGHSAAIFTNESVSPSDLSEIMKDVYGENGDISIESIIGSDNRVQITNTVTYPNYSIISAVSMWGVQVL